MRKLLCATKVPQPECADVDWPMPTAAAYFLARLSLRRAVPSKSKEETTLVIAVSGVACILARAGWPSLTVTASAPKRQAIRRKAGRNGNDVGR